MKDNFGFKHKAGIFCAVSMLPNKYGIGGFGKEAYDFIDFLCETGQKVWQVLPLNPTAYGDSPYQSPSSFAGNPYFIDPYLLYKDGLLTREELKEYEVECDSVDYGRLFSTRYNLLSKAYARFEKVGLYVDYCNKNKSWLDDYALYMALKVTHNYAAWSTWDNEYKYYKTAKTHAEEFKDEADFWRFIQYEFEKQWQNVLSYARKKGVTVLGDMPIYVSFDSVDIWARPEEFLLDENLSPTIVAGCPPDGFSPDGQLWGNPIYDWEKMKQNGFSWWVERFKRAKDLYDIVRIDHFRGFAGFYAVPYGDATARNGKWYDGVGYSLFEKVHSVIPDLKVIAEDLGYITPDVLTLMEETGYPGMKMLQFAFYDADAKYLPRNYENDNCVVYTGTHDSDATHYWTESMEPHTREVFMREVPVKDKQPLVDALILFAHESRANLSMVPLIDYMRLGNDARMNVPGESKGNWSFRINKNYATKSLKKHILALTKEGGRI